MEVTAGVGSRESLAAFNVVQLVPCEEYVGYSLLEVSSVDCLLLPLLVSVALGLSVLSNAVAVVMGHGSGGVLLSDLLQLAPLLEDLLGLDIFNGGQLLSVELVATEAVKVHLLAKLLVLDADLLEDVGDLLTLQDGLVVHAGDGVEDGPHHLGVVDLAFVVSDVEAENYFI